MFRSFIPLLLASLGFILFGLVIEMPLFEWQISEITTDSSRNGHFNSLSWTTKLGDSLVDVLYCGNSSHPEGLKPVVKRSWREETVERITRTINRNVFPWLWLLLFLSGFYIWGSALHQKRSSTEALISTVAAMIFICILLDITRFFYAYSGRPACLENTVPFTATLSKTHYETLLLLFAAILAEVGAVSIMLRQIRRAIIEKKESAKLAVG